MLFLLLTHLTLALAACLLAHNAARTKSVDREAFLFGVWVVGWTGAMLYAMSLPVATAALSSLLTALLIRRALRPRALAETPTRAVRRPSRLVWEEDLPALLEDRSSLRVVTVSRHSRAHRVYEGIASEEEARALALSLTARSMDAPGRTLSPAERLQRWHRRGIAAVVPATSYRTDSAVDLLALFLVRSAA